MKTNTLNLQETSLNISESRDMIFSIIDNQINTYKLQFLSEWEGNHQTSSQEKDSKIQRLNDAKEHFREFFKNLQSTTNLDVHLNLQVELKPKHQSSSNETSNTLSVSHHS